MRVRESFDVTLVDDGLIQWRTRWPIPSPVERLVNDDASRNVWRAIRTLRCGGSPHRSGEHRVVPLKRTGDRSSVRIEKQFRPIVTMTRAEIVRAVNPETVRLAWPDALDITPPHAPGIFVEFNGPGFEGIVSVSEQA